MRQEQRSTLAIPVILLSLGLFTLASALEENAPNTQDDKSTNLEYDLDFDKRLYNFGLGKRAYSYVSEYKRLPVYNFGLGKRAQRYDFGLGKRNEVDDDEDGLEEYENYQYDDEDDSRSSDSGLYLDNEAPTYDKRQKWFSSTYGKRLPKYDFGLGKRGRTYDFGLGKRARQYDFGLGKKSPRFNFGLGKRTRMYNFGLGKRPAAPSRFDFGLGKRSVELDSYLQKREVPANENEENNSAETEFAHPPANVAADKQNETVEIDSHEIMGHSDRSSAHLAKRSAYSYDFGLGKRGNYQYSVGSGFSRQFRRPLYNFGLGKRSSILNSDLAKMSYQT